MNRGEKYALEAKRLLDHADLEGRRLTPEEEGQFNELLAKARQARDGQQGVMANIAQLGRAIGGDDLAGVGQRPGDQFVASEGYKRIVDPAARGSHWSSGPVEIKAARWGGVQTKATLLEGDVDAAGTGGAMVPYDTRPGVQPILFERPTVADLLATAPTDSNKVRVIVETVADPGSIGTVEEGALKPEATLEFDEVDEPVRKVASFLPASDEMISDAPGLRAYLNGRLTLFVQQEEENQLLNGTGAGTDLDGLLNRVLPANQGVVSDATAANDADHIHAAMTVVRASFLEPDGVVINPADWDALRLLKDQNNNYLGGSPFSNGAAQPGELLFGKKVVVTSAIAQGTALVGAFATAATIYRRGGLIVEASNSHLDYFQRDLTAIRAEVRLALGVNRPEALATCDLTSS